MRGEAKTGRPGRAEPYARQVNEPVYLPLPERVRPSTLDGILGQAHLLGPGTPLRQAIEQDRLGSLILVGPPGCGKTTLARAIAHTTDAAFHEFSAVAAGKADVTKVIEAAKTLREAEGRRTILFIDEVHRFNAVQQDALLGAVESGTIILIGATTENPGSTIRDALRSRCQILRLRLLDERSMTQILASGAAALGTPAFSRDALARLAHAFRGDARSALIALEEAHAYATANGAAEIDGALLDAMPAERRVFYDRDSTHHHAVVSAFIKSMRGSHADAALYYLAVMLDGGEDPLFIARRIAIAAAEDVGLADPHALMVAQAALAITREIGLPECRIPLAEATIYLSCAPKSRSAIEAIDAAETAVAERGAAAPPRHLTPIGRADYIYPQEQPDTRQQYLPTGVRGGFYQPKPVGIEKKIYDRRHPAA